MNLWTDERKMPDSLAELLKVPDIPEDLRKELLQACKEIERRAVESGDVYHFNWGEGIDWAVAERA